MANRWWTEQDIQFLEENYGKMKVREIAKKLDRSEASIKLKASKMGLYSRRCKDEWIDYIRENTGKKSRIQMAKALGIKPQQVYNIISNYGIDSFTVSHEELLSADVSKILGVHYTRVCPTLENKGMKFKRMGHYKTIKEENLIKFLKNNQDLWDSTKADYCFFQRYDWFHEKLKRDRERKYDGEKKTKTFK